MNDYRYRKQIFLEFAGSSRFDIDKCILLPDGERSITVSDRLNPDHSTTYVQSHIPTISDDEIRSFLLRQMKVIQSGIYDE
ncbi:hypothetical protein SAMN04487936_107214 [Halobacillus dabanensis]|uniref:Uncharacterized protein n=1 Tax=Halobacillus dabanensis TaxID=240302 RepID=A0A1I3WYC0_HALDA|nr:hypothetical protein [Halobacillus dabanensis]SFK12498.1 hypothetical protein SAMN04487936_107214 [Halobacillus dabanensis]